jgi:hypothetical protein
VDVDDELPDYVMIMVGNKKTKDRMKADLKLFLAEHTCDFVEWYRISLRISLIVAKLMRKLRQRKMVRIEYAEAAY